MPRGQLILISAPSGAGKTSLVKTVTARCDKLVVSISHTTRAMRPGERDQVNYFFVSNTEFEQMIERGAFLEHALVFGHHYGTSFKQMNTQREAGLDVILEIDWQGAAQIQKLVPEALSIFILPPSIEALAERLHNRGQDQEAIIEQRLQAARSDIKKAASYSYVLINDDFEEATEQLITVITAGRLRTDHQLSTSSLVQSMVGE